MWSNSPYQSHHAGDRRHPAQAQPAIPGEATWLADTRPPPFAASYLPPQNEASLATRIFCPKKILRKGDWSPAHLKSFYTHFWTKNAQKREVNWCKARWMPGIWKEKNLSQIISQPTSTLPTQGFLKVHLPHDWEDGSANQKKREYSIRMMIELISEILVGKSAFLFSDFSWWIMRIPLKRR